MDEDAPSFPNDLVQLHPGLGLLRFAALLSDGIEADEETLEAMCEQVEIGALDRLPPTDIWQEFSKGLMGAKPSSMLHALRACGVLEAVLPEVHAVFGVPQIADEGKEVDLGDVLLLSLDAAAAIGAPLDVRFAVLTMNVGKADSPRHQLPAHPRHMERGAPRIRAIAERFQLGAAGGGLALLALRECERIHRTSHVRPGPVAALLARLDAFDEPERFLHLLDVAHCDYAGHVGRSGTTYPKAALLANALSACTGLDPDTYETPEDLMTARSAAIAQAFRAHRWSDDAL